MRFALPAIILCLSVIGCRVSPHAEREIAMLRAEILDLEDQYYAIKSQRDSAVSRLRDCGVDYMIDGECVDCGPGSVLYGGSGGASLDSGRGFETAPSSRSEPTLSVEDQIEEERNGPGTRQNRAPSLEEISPDSASYSNSNGTRLVSETGQISRIVINRRFSGGQDLDGKTGHEGLALLIQPINESGQVQKTAGHVIRRIRSTDWFVAVYAEGN